MTEYDDLLDRFLVRYEHARVVIGKLTDRATEFPIEKRLRYMDLVLETAEVFDAMRVDWTELVSAHVKEIDDCLKLLNEKTDNG